MMASSCLAFFTLQKRPETKKRLLFHWSLSKGTKVQWDYARHEGAWRYVVILERKEYIKILLLQQNLRLTNFIKKCSSWFWIPGESSKDLLASRILRWHSFTWQLTGNAHIYVPGLCFYSYKATRIQS